MTTRIPFSLLPSGIGGMTTLSPNFTFASLLTPGIYYGLTDTTDGPETPSGTPPYTVEITRYATGNLTNGDLIVQRARTYIGAEYIRYGYVTLGQFAPWDAVSLAVGTGAVRPVDNFNTLVSTGLYRTTTGGVANAPISTTGLIVRVSRTSATTVLQEAFLGSQMWFRLKVGSTWGNWASTGSNRLYKATLSANTTLDTTLYDVFDITLGGNVVLTVPKPAPALLQTEEVTKTIRIRQNASTKYTCSIVGVAFSSVFRWGTSGGTAPDASPALGKIKEYIGTAQYAGSAEVNWLMRVGFTDE